MKNKCLSMSLELSILGLTVRNDRRNVQLLWAQGHCVVVFPGCHGSLQTETLPQDASVGKNIRVLMTPPLGRVQQTPCGLSPWADGPGMWMNCVAVVMIPIHPGTFTTPTYFTQHAPTFGPRTQFAWSHGTILAGCHQTPNASTTETTCARDSACRETWHPMMTKQHPWADGWELSADGILKEGKCKEFYSK